MRLYFKQRVFSWLDSYEVYDRMGNVVYIVRGQLTQGHCLKIYGVDGTEVGTVWEQTIDRTAQFDVFKGSEYIGALKREISFLAPEYSINYKDWSIKGNFAKVDYTIVDDAFNYVGSGSKTMFRLADHYVIDVDDSQDPLIVLMFAIAIDADMGSRS